MTIVKFQDPDGTWREKISMQREKFDDEAKEIFLSEYAKHARMTDAALAAGVTGPTVRNHMKKDTDFAEACLAAQAQYKDRLIAHHQKLVFEGTDKISYDRNGNKISEETVYPLRLIELELKKHDEGYRDKREVDMKVSGGVMIAPADVKTIEDWEQNFQNAKIIEGVAEEIKDDKIKEP
jgi:hypothetical protein